MAVLCAAALWLLVSAASLKNEAAEERNLNYEELQSIYQAKVFPNDANIERTQADRKVVEDWLIAASNQLHQGDLALARLTPAGFKQKLQSRVRELSDHPGAAGGRIVAPNFYFGFNKYLGQSDSLPESDHVERLTFQLEVVNRVCQELYAANIMELKSVTREAFDDDSPAGGAADGAGAVTQRRRRRQADAGERRPAADVKRREESPYFSKQRFGFEFVARPAAFVDALNRLSKMELFVMVAEVELRKSGDQLVEREKAAKKDETAKRSGASEAEARIDPATLTHMQRIFTDPELEPPVSVKLAVDVYSFDGA